MIQIITDTASDITYSEAQEMNIYLASLPILFGETEYNQREDETSSEFYKLLKKSKKLPSTSQVTPNQYLDIFSAAKKNGDDVIVITLSSGLSGTYGSAQLAMEMIEYDRISVIDSRQATLSQRMLVEYAVNLRDSGKSALEITEMIIGARDRVTVCGLLSTLTYLKKGGRIPPALSLIGNALHIMPSLILRDKKLEVLAKTMGFNNGIKSLYEEFEKGELDPDWPVVFGYSMEIDVCEKFMKETVAKYDLKNTQLRPIGGVIGTHLGPGCVAIAFVRK